MSNSYIFDLNAIVEEIMADLRECGEVIRLPYSGNEMTYEELIINLESNTGGDKHVLDRDVERLDDMLYELAKEFVFQRLMSRYKTIPLGYDNLYLDILDKLFVAPSDREFMVDTAVAIGQHALQYAEVYVDRILMVMPANEWTMLDYDVTNTAVIITTGMDFRDFYFKAMFGDKRWEGDFITAGSPLSTLRQQNQREQDDATIMEVCRQASRVGSRRMGSRRATMNRRAALRALVDGNS